LLKPITRGLTISSKAGLLTQLSTPCFVFSAFTNDCAFAPEARLLHYSDEFVRDFHPSSLFTGYINLSDTLDVYSLGTYYTATEFFCQ
jgi:hypothetical protein